MLLIWCPESQLAVETSLLNGCNYHLQLSSLQRMPNSFRKGLCLDAMKTSSLKHFWYPKPTSFKSASLYYELEPGLSFNPHKRNLTYLKFTSGRMGTIERNWREFGAYLGHGVAFSRIFHPPLIGRSPPHRCPAPENLMSPYWNGSVGDTLLKMDPWFRQIL